MLRCIIIEDQPPAQRILQKFITDIGTLELIGTFSDAIQAMQFLQQQTVDLIFLDIHLPKISGIDFLKTIPNHPKVILTTAFSDYALESYEYNVVDYLLKPFSFQRFIQAVSKAQANQPVSSTQESPVVTAPTNETLFIKSGYDLIKVNTADIYYIKSDADYTEIVTSIGKHLSAEPLKYWLHKLSDVQFCQVHKSYIINTQVLEKVSGNQVYLYNDIVIPIGRTYKEQFIKKYLT